MKKYISQEEVKNQIHNIIRDMHNTHHWKPDMIIGIGRDGIVPAIMLGSYLNIPVYASNVTEKCVDCGLAEDIFGYISKENRVDDAAFCLEIRKKVLFVVGVNPNNSELSQLIDDLQKSCLPDDPSWNDIWFKSVRFAALIDTSPSTFKNIEYCGQEEYNNIEYSTEYVFPWNWWWNS